jgi:hypothetical protein
MSPYISAQDKPRRYNFSLPVLVPYNIIVYLFIHVFIYCCRVRMCKWECDLSLYNALYIPRLCMDYCGSGNLHE